MEGDRIPLLKGHGQALEQKHCFPGIFIDGCDASANLLNNVIIIIIISSSSSSSSSSKQLSDETEADTASDVMD